MSAYIVIDTETGGFSADKCGLTEIAAVAALWNGRTEPRVVEQFAVLIKPIDGLEYKAAALRLQHRTLEELQEKGTIEPAALLSFYGWLYGIHRHYGKYRVWAHNADFDKRFLLAAAARLNAEESEYIAFPPIGIDWQCSAERFKALKRAGMHHCQSSNLDAVCQYYKISIPEAVRHTGAADAYATALCVARMQSDWNSLPAQQRQAIILDGQLGPGHE